MKEYKINVLNALNDAAKELKTVKIKEVAQSAGVSRLTHNECLEIADRFIKSNPTYRLVKMCTEKQMRYSSTASLWETGVLTECEFD